MTTIYGNHTWQWCTDRFLENGGEARVEAGHLLVPGADARDATPVDGLLQLRSRSPLLDAMFHLAVRDSLALIRPSGLIVAGASRHFDRLLVYTRDIAWSAYLGLSFVMPEAIRDHLLLDRELRYKLGFRCSKDHAIPLPHVPNEVEYLSETDFFRKHGTNSFSRRTDDIIFNLGWFSNAVLRRDLEDLRYQLDSFARFDEKMYRHFYDESDGLYRGQACFIDVDGNGYPGYGVQDCVMIKALSTNCLYVAAFDRLAEACHLLGNIEQGANFRVRAAQLRNAIRREFILPEGFYAYFKRADGTLEPRREQVGTASLVLFDILHEKAERQHALSQYPANDYGSPLFYPFYSDSEVSHHPRPWYHNQGLWPFADQLMRRAAHRTDPSDEGLLSALGRLCRHSLKGSLMEVLHYDSGDLRGSPACLWSNAALVDAIMHNVLGIEATWDRVRLTPHLPVALGPRLEVRHIKLGAMTIDVVLSGTGNRIASCRIDGHEADPVLARDDQAHTCEIELT